MIAIAESRFRALKRILRVWFSAAALGSTIVRRIAKTNLLDGLQGEARTTRIAILTRLYKAGASTSELVQATDDGRLAHLLLKDALTSRGTMRTLPEISELAGVEIADVERWFRAMGRGVSGRTSADYSDDDLRLAQSLIDYRELGLDELGLFASARILGRNTWAMADAVESLLRERLEVAGEHPEVALRFAAEIGRLASFQANILGHVLATRLRQAAAIGTVDVSAADNMELAVCFADLVGFTALAETASPDDLARLAERFDTLTTDVIEHPVRFVKTVGDAVMLISPDPAALVAAVQRLFDLARAEQLPALHAGIAWGQALPSAGDWIGRPVNLASRIATVAQPNVILVDEALRSRLDPNVASESAGSFRLKGFESPHELFVLNSSRDDMSEDIAADSDSQP